MRESGGLVKSIVSVALFLAAMGVLGGLGGTWMSPNADASKAREIAAKNSKKSRDAGTAGQNVATAAAGGADSTTEEGAASESETTQVTVGSGDTLMGLLQRQGVDAATALAAGRAFEEVRERPLRPGDRIRIQFSANKTFAGLAFNLQDDRRVTVKRAPDGDFVGRAGTPTHEMALVHVGADIDSSLMMAAAQAGIPSDLAVRAANILGQRVDLQRDLRRGDRLEVTYERLTDVDTGETHSGRLKYIEFDGARVQVAAYRFDPGNGAAFFDRKGRSLPTGFLRTPVDGARLSSPFGKRDHPVLGYTRKHEGLDFAAPRGTEVVAASDGVVARASRYGSFGKFVRIRHGDGLVSAYAHLNGYAEGVTEGARVEQGQVIGYVGATGLATGPNLHYEVRRDGTPVDPMKLDRPPRRILDGDDLERFRKVVASMQSRIQTAHARQATESEADAGKVETSGS